MPACQITDLNVNFIQKLRENSRPGKAPSRGSIPVREGTKPSRAFKVVSGMFRQDATAGVPSLGSDMKPHNVTSVDTVLARAQAAIHDITTQGGGQTDIVTKPNPAVNVNTAENTPGLTQDNSILPTADTSVTPGVVSDAAAVPSAVGVPGTVDVPSTVAVPSVGNVPSQEPEKRDHLPPGIVCGDGYQLQCSCVRR